jgi:hypothetical protein
MKHHSFGFINILFIIAFSISVTACSVTISTGSETQKVPAVIDVTGTNQPAAAAPPAISASPTLNPNLPGEPTTVEVQVKDPDSSKYASEKRVVTGDSYKSNFFERPFTASSMIYLPDVDIVNGYISSDEKYFYFTIELVGVNKDNGKMMANYGVELDTDKDGRGDYSIWVLNPEGKIWSTANVKVLKDNNNSVGGKDAYIADSSLFLGNGYETVIPNNGADAAWARINPNVPNIVQIAVHKNLIGNPFEFLFGFWADNGPKNPNLFDYDDHFTYEDAGTPIIANQYYPLKKVPAIDNTCRRTYGFAVSYRIPNMCWSGGPVIETPEKKKFTFLCLDCLFTYIPICGCPPAPGCPPC